MRFARSSGTSSAMSEAFPHSYYLRLPRREGRAPARWQSFPAGSALHPDQREPLTGNERRRCDLHGLCPRRQRVFSSRSENRDCHCRSCPCGARLLCTKISAARKSDYLLPERICRCRDDDARASSTVQTKRCVVACLAVPLDRCGTCLSTRKRTSVESE